MEKETIADQKEIQDFNVNQCFVKWIKVINLTTVIDKSDLITRFADKVR
jgi:hypothetical protein